MTSTLLIVIVAGVWALGAVAGYFLARWSNRAMGCTWTRNDRLFALVFSTLYGPLMPVFVIVVLLIYKLLSSQWGSREARW